MTDTINIKLIMGKRSSLLSVTDRSDLYQKMLTKASDDFKLIDGTFILVLKGIVLDPLSIIDVNDDFEVSVHVLSHRK